MQTMRQEHAFCRLGAVVQRSMTIKAVGQCDFHELGGERGVDLQPLCWCAAKCYPDQSVSNRWRVLGHRTEHDELCNSQCDRIRRCICKHTLHLQHCYHGIPNDGNGIARIRV